MYNNRNQYGEFDYYNIFNSYVKMIVELMPVERRINGDEVMLKTLFNYYFESYNTDMKAEVVQIGKMFEKKISTIDASALIEYLYDVYIREIIVDSDNRERLFDELNSRLKKYVGYYSLESVYHDQIERINDQKGKSAYMK